MNKQLLIIGTTLVLATSLNASGRVKEEYRFRPAFQKKLKRVKAIGLGSFRSGSLKQKSERKAAFIDWRKLYWGRLSDLVYSEEACAVGGHEGASGTQEQEDLSIDTEDTQFFASELRHELKAFARHYGLKIVWRKKSPELPDVTTDFLDYWDKGTCEEKGVDLLRKVHKG